jgi:DNA-binding LacI/PurR family transcriptional regulator
MARGVITSADVAARAGVSRSAVSRCFTPGASVSSQTRARVMDAAQALGYRPNAIARSLNKGRSRIIAVVLGYMDNPFYPAMLERLAESLRSRGYRLLLFTARSDGSGDELLSEILDYQVDGVILASILLTSGLAQRCRAARIPLVLVNRTTEDRDVSSVTADNRVGARAMADFLLAGGHRRFAFVAGLASSSTNHDREVAFRARLAEAGVNAVMREEGGYTWEGAREATRRLLRGPRPPDAIFCANDHMAMAAMDVARFEFGLRAPDDVSIVGYDDVAGTAWPSYRLTTVEQPVDAMARAAVDVLMARVEGDERGGAQVRIPGELVVRESARRPPKGVVSMDGREIWRPRERAKPPRARA